MYICTCNHNESVNKQIQIQLQSKFDNMWNLGAPRNLEALPMDPRMQQQNQKDGFQNIKIAFMSKMFIK